MIKRQRFGKEISKLIERWNVLNINSAHVLMRVLMFLNKVKHNIDVLSVTMEFGIMYRSDSALIVGEESCGL